jgi:hypothetical protein
MKGTIEGDATDTVKWTEDLKPSYKIRANKKGKEDTYA